MHIISSFYSQRLERVETIISGSATGKENDTSIQSTQNKIE